MAMDSVELDAVMGRTRKFGIPIAVSPKYIGGVF